MTSTAVSTFQFTILFIRGIDSHCGTREEYHPNKSFIRVKAKNNKYKSSIAMPPMYRRNDVLKRFGLSNEIIEEKTERTQ